MNIKKRGGARRTVAVIAAMLALFTVFGALAALFPADDIPVIDVPYRPSDVILTKIATIDVRKNDAVTAASYTNGTYLVSYYNDDATTLLLASSDGKTWENVIDHPTINGQVPYDSILDEIVYINNTWFFGFFGWGNEANGYIFRFVPTSGENSGFGADWQVSFDGRSYGSGRFTAMEVVDGKLYVVSENGGFYYKTPGGAWYEVREGEYPFAGYHVTDLAKCGDTYLALATDAEGTVVLSSPAINGAWWTAHRIEGVKANRFDTANGACFMACDDGKIVFSSDLSTWKTSCMSDTVDFTEFFTFGGKHYAIGANDNYGVLYESENGVTWERVVSVNEPLSAVSVGNGEVFLYGDLGGVYRLTK